MLRVSITLEFSLEGEELVSSGNTTRVVEVLKTIKPEIFGLKEGETVGLVDLFEAVEI